LQAAVPVSLDPLLARLVGAAPSSLAGCLQARWPAMASDFVSGLPARTFSGE
jgi:hypothetical protein